MHHMFGRNHIYKYECPECGATKEIRDPYDVSGSPPETLICGWRGCTGEAERIIPKKRFR